MITLTISANAYSSKRNELLSAFRFMAEQARQEEGCVSYRLFQDIDNANGINLEEKWRDRSFMDNHFRSDIFSALLGAVTLLGETHEIRINDGSHEEGMVAVRSARVSNSTPD